MKTGTEVYYLLADQLGSTSITTSATGAKISELRYDAWGSVRYSSGDTATKYTYTGQYAYESLGLDYYVARFYDPALGRFTQADSVVPGGVQGYDRYAYANNAPTTYADPSGHAADSGGAAGGCAPTACNYPDSAVSGGSSGSSNGGQGGSLYEQYSSWFSGAYGSCFMCHAAVAQNQTSLTDAQLAEAYEYFYENLAYSAQAGGEFTALSVPIIFAVISGLPPSPEAQRVLGNFEGTPTAITLEQDISAYRYWSPGGSAVGQWLSLDGSLTSAEARAGPALPNQNLATNVTQFVIPKGTSVLYGIARQQLGNPQLFGAYATGGSLQIFVEHPGVLRPVPLLPPGP